MSNLLELFGVKNYDELLMFVIEHPGDERSIELLQVFRYIEDQSEKEDETE